MPLAPTSFLTSRLGRLREALAAQGLDALVVTHLPNIFYLTNFSGSSAIAVVARARLYFITDFRYVTSFEALLASDRGCADAALVPVDGSYDEALAGLVGQIGARRIGFEASHLSVARHRWLSSALGATSRGSDSTEPAGDQGQEGRVLVPTEHVIEQARRRKDAHEVRTLRAAAVLLSEVAAAQLDNVRSGRTEREVAADIDWAIRRAGFERPAFETIVASGPNGALPHARPTARRLEPGDLVVLDFGGVYDGYCVDLTSTVSIGEPTGEARRVYDAVLEAQGAAIAAARPGRRAWEIDDAARSVLARHGLADAFGHGTGHGLGIEIHEEPRIGKRRDQPTASGADAGGGTSDLLEADMVFTIEPGAYLPGWGGVRIEDDVLLTPTGCEVLTGVPRALLARP